MIRAVSSWTCSKVLRRWAISLRIFLSACMIIVMVPLMIAAGIFTHITARHSVARQVASGQGMSVRATEEAVVLLRREAPDKPRPAKRRPMHAPGLQDLAERLSDRFDTRVKVELGQRKGRIVVEFGSVEDLERIAELMNRSAGA